MIAGCAWCTLPDIQRPKASTMSPREAHSSPLSPLPPPWHACVGASGPAKSTLKFGPWASSARKEYVRPCCSPTLSSPCSHALHTPVLVIPHRQLAYYRLQSHRHSGRGAAAWCAACACCPCLCTLSPTLSPMQVSHLHLELPCWPPQAEGGAVRGGDRDWEPQAQTRGAVWREEEDPSKYVPQ